jgi:hypothetical protein
MEIVPDFDEYTTVIELMTVQWELIQWELYTRFIDSDHVFEPESLSSPPKPLFSQQPSHDNDKKADLVYRFSLLLDRQTIFCTKDRWVHNVDHIRLRP